MNATVRRMLLGIPGMGGPYRRARKTYHRWRSIRAARDYFVDVDKYREALDSVDGGTVDLRTKDGLILTVRHNYADAAVLAEVFFENSYDRGLHLGEAPVIVDIGGYIGDFAIYAVTRLKARKVVVCEPSLQNWTLLER